MDRGGYGLDLKSRHVAGLILRSEDGRTWNREPEQADVEFDRILTTSSQVFIVGSHRQPDIGDQHGLARPAIWSSADGRTWTEGSPPSEIDERWAFSNTAIGGPGWLMRAGKIGVDEERWWTGDPSSDWTEVSPAADAFPDAYVFDFVGTDDGWMAFGMTGADRGSDSLFAHGDPKNDRGAIWSSTDGITWIAAPIDDPGTSVTGVHRLARGWFAIGGDHGGCPRCLGGQSLLWRSDDGRTWSRLELETSLNKALGWGQIASDGHRGLLFDTDESGRIRVRQTEDGNGWLEIAVFIDVSAKGVQPATGGAVGVGPGGVVWFVDPATGPLDRFWMVPQVAIAGEPPASAATQSPAPPRENHDVVCPNANGERCGP
jgi:hypothetical protein